MAFFTDTQIREAGLVARAASALSHWFGDLADTLARRGIARRTYTELSSLNDRELIDLGLTRSDIRRVAYEAAQGKL